MAKDIREIIKKFPKTQQQAIKRRAKALIKEEKMARLLLRARVELSKLGLTVDQLKSAVAKRSEDRLKTRYPAVFKDKT